MCCRLLLFFIFFTLLFKYASLALQLGLARDHRIEELDLGKEESLRLQLEGHAVADIVDELFETEELDAAEGAPVAPVNVDLHFARLVQIDAETLVPGLLGARPPIRLRHSHIVQLDDGHDLVARLVLDAVRLGRAPPRHAWKRKTRANENKRKPSMIVTTHNNPGHYSD